MGDLALPAVQRITESVSPPPADTRALRYDLQAVARGVVSWEYRLAFCRRKVVTKVASLVELLHGREGRAWFGNLFTCGLLWLCPPCAARVSEARRQELKLGIRHLRTIYPSLSVVQACFTLQHHAGHGLAESYEALSGALSGLRNGEPWRRIEKRFDIIGSVSSLELTIGKETGYHPHRHYLFFSRLPADKLEDFAGWVMDRYQRYLRRKGRWASSAGLQFTCKQAGARDALYCTKWGMIEEVTKGSAKRASSVDRYTPFGLLELLLYDDDDWAARCFGEYAEVFKGKRQLVYSRGLRELMGLSNVTDVDAASDDGNQPVVLALLDLRQWRYIWAGVYRAELLNVAEKNPDPWAVCVYLESIGVPCVDEVRERIRICYQQPGIVGENLMVGGFENRVQRAYVLGLPCDQNGVPFEEDVDALYE